MIFFVREIYDSENIKKTAGSKARDDCDKIMFDLGYRPIDVYSNEAVRSKSNSFVKTFWHLKMVKVWRESCGIIKTGDSVVFQMPLREQTLFFSLVIKWLRQRGIRVILFIHDLEILRWSKRNDTGLTRRVKLKMEELTVLKLADVVVAHNDSMKNYLVQLGVDESRIRVLEIFDYLLESLDLDSRNERIKKDNPLIIAGNLRRHKAEYVYNLPENIKFNLYGVGYNNELKDNICYCGSFLPEELVTELTGNFGVVWDGVSSETCTGVYGDYLKINNPHKTSLYLAAGIPVIIWKQAALAEFIEKNKCGLTVESLHDIHDIVESLSPEEYEIIKNNAETVGKKIRNGEFAKSVLCSM